MCVPFAPYFLGQNCRAPVDTKSQSTRASITFWRKTSQFIVISCSMGTHWRVQHQGTHENDIDYTGACETLLGGGQKGTQAHPSGGQGREKVTSATQVQCKLDPKPLQGAPSCESSPRVHAKMVLATQVRAKLIRKGQRAPQAHSSGALGR